VGTHVQFGILGPLEVRVGGTLVPVGGPRQRALLALLLCHANQVVSRDRLIDELLRDQAAGTVDRTLRVQISRLRKALADGDPQSRLLARPPGYLLRVEDGELDLHTFEQQVADGRRALETGDPRRAAVLLRQAESLWRGRPLADLEFEPFARSEIQRLEALRLLAVEDRVEAELALGRHTVLCPELEQLVAENPLRERLRGQLMLALYRSGRQADALETYRAGRSLLVEELGLDPGPELQRLECAILQQDAGLDLPGRAVAAAGRDAAQGTGRSWLTGPGRKKRMLAAAAAAAVAGALLAAVAPRGPAAPLAGGPDTVGVIGPGPALRAVVTGVGRPDGIAYGAGAAWVTDSADDLLLQVDPAGQVIDRIPVGRGPAGVTAGAGEIWVANELDGTVSEVNPGAGRQVAVIPVGIGPSQIAFGYGSVWVANVASDTLSRIDPATGAVAPAISVGAAPNGIAAGAGAVWVTSQETGELLRVDPASDRTVQAIAIGPSPDGVAIGAGSIWVADASGRLTRFDPRTGRLRTIRMGGAPAGVVYADGAVWVAGGISGTVAEVDPATGAAQLIRVGNEPADLAAAGQDVWVTVLPAPAAHRGGTLTVLEQAPPGHPALPTDPAVAYYSLTWQMLSMTNDGLVGYRRAGGLAGDQLVPDLATALPAPADDGITYTFRLRGGIRYSTGALVRPEDFRRAIERVFTLDKQLNPYIPPEYAGIAGAAQCEHTPGPCDLASGIAADDRTDTVTFHLTAPDPAFLYKLAFSWAYAVPAGTPDHPLSAAQLPATGPYLTQSLQPGHTWVLVRNPLFRPWSQQAQPDGYPDRIVLRLDVGPGQSVADVEHGRADVLLAPPPGAIGQLATHYTSQLHSGPLAATIALALNTRIPPFSSPAARRALNYAIDRNKVTALNGGPLTVRPTCQILPPAMPGYQPYCPYTITPNTSGAWTAPDLALAQQLVRASGTRGDTVTVADGAFDPLPAPATGRYLVSVLDQLGYHASLRMLGPNDYFSVLGDSRDRVQAGFYAWYQDYPAPSDFIDPLLSCGSFLPGNPGNSNVAEFCDPAIDTQAQHALTLQARDPATAAGQWAAIDRELVDAAPWAPLYNPTDLTVLSARTGNYQFHPYWNLLIDQLWVR
jgi:peptide/nickel transport system substrate-binding protein